MPERGSRGVALEEGVNPGRTFFRLLGTHHVTLVVAGHLIVIRRKGFKVADLMTFDNLMLGLACLDTSQTLKRIL